MAVGHQPGDGARLGVVAGEDAVTVRRPFHRREDPLLHIVAHLLHRDPGRPSEVDGAQAAGSAVSSLSAGIR
nr:hypothetical protein [Actinomadura sp. HBU206391]